MCVRVYIVKIICVRVYIVKIMCVRVYIVKIMCVRVYIVKIVCVRVYIVKIVCVCARVWWGEGGGGEWERQTAEVDGDNLCIHIQCRKFFLFLSRCVTRPTT